MQEIAKKMTAKEIEDKLKEIGYAIDGIKNESENKWINGNIWVQQLKQKIEEAKAYLNNLEADKYDDFADELRNQITVSENYKDLSDTDLKALRSDLSKKLSEIKAKAENRKREWIQAQEKLAKLKEKAFDLQKTLNDRFHFALLRQFNILNNSLVENELTYLNIKSKLKEFEDKLKQIELDSNIRLAEFEALKNFDDGEIEDFYEFARNKVNKKSAFASSLLYFEDEENTWKVPNYISEGLLWLREQ